MKKYLYWNAVTSIPVGAILILIGAWVFINSSDKTGANGFFLAGIGVMFFGAIWYLIYRKKNNQRNSP